MLLSKVRLMYMLVWHLSVPSKQAKTWLNLIFALTLDWNPGYCENWEGGHPSPESLTKIVRHHFVVRVSSWANLVCLGEITTGEVRNCWFRGSEGHSLDSIKTRVMCEVVWGSSGNVLCSRTDHRDCCLDTRSSSFFINAIICSWPQVVPLKKK